MMIEFENVSLTLGQFALHDISLKVNEGDYYFILGPSGAGKTVVLEAVAGLHQPDSGTVLLRGEDMQNIPPEKRNISLVYQDYSLFPHMDVFNNVAFGLKMRKKSKHEIKTVVDDMLHHFGISHIRNRATLTLSGGEQQRVALCRALVVEPEFLLLDEPLSAMDPLTKDQFIGVLHDLHQEQGLTIVEVTHSRREAKALATHIAVIMDGYLEQEDTTQRVFECPVNPEVATFLGVENIFEGVLTERKGDDALVQAGNLLIQALSDLPTGTPVYMYVRAISVAVKPKTEKIRPGQNAIAGTVTMLLPHGDLWKITIDAGVPLYALLSADEVKSADITIGTEVVACFDPDAVHLCVKTSEPLPSSNK